MTAKEKFQALARKQKEAINRQKATEQKRAYRAALKDKLGYCTTGAHRTNGHGTGGNSGTRKQPQAPSGYMSLKEAAAKNGYSYNGIQIAHIRGTLKCTKIGGRYYVRQEDIDAYKVSVAESRRISAAMAHEAWKAQRAQRMGNA